MEEKDHQGISATAAPSTIEHNGDSSNNKGSAFKRPRRPAPPASRTSSRIAIIREEAKASRSKPRVPEEVADRRNWTNSEKEKLAKAVSKHGSRNVKKLAQKVWKPKQKFHMGGTIFLQHILLGWHQKRRVHQDNFDQNKARPELYRFIPVCPSRRSYPCRTSKVESQKKTCKWTVFLC